MKIEEIFVKKKFMKDKSFNLFKLVLIFVYLIKCFSQFSFLKNFFVYISLVLSYIN